MGNRGCSDSCPDRVAEKGLEGVDIFDEATYPEDSVGRKVMCKGPGVGRAPGLDCVRSRKEHVGSETPA